MWIRDDLYDDLTICIFSRNLKTLCYPVFESIASTLPLGCRYIVGDASSDDTKQLWPELAKYIPLEVIHLEWPLDKEPGWKAVAMGICTERTIAKCQTRLAYNLQASEVLDTDAVEGIKAKGKDLTVTSFWFRHFYGSMSNGGRAYHGYGDAPRIFRPGTKFDRTDACYPNDYDGGYPAIHGHINRYGYCWKNNIIKKYLNKNSLYDGHNTEAQAIDFYNWGHGLLCACSTPLSPYPREAHPWCVQHLIDLENYDYEFSKQWFINLFK